MKWIKRIVESIRYRFIKYIVRPGKEYWEFQSWKSKKKNEGTLRNTHYKTFYTEMFNLSESFYSGKRILDIGCGPRGSLEWADMSQERIGLDPLAKSYLKIGANRHKMKYVASGSESIPFPDGYFDVVCSFNSLDHVDDVDRSISEIKRVLADDGSLLLITELNHAPRNTEPQTFSWEIVENLKPEMEILFEKHIEIVMNGVYECVRESVPFNHDDPVSRPGILQLHAIKKSPKQKDPLLHGDTE